MKIFYALANNFQIGEFVLSCPGDVSGIGVAGKQVAQLPVSGVAAFPGFSRSDFAHAWRR
jgi:hypothetical protein